MNLDASAAGSGSMSTARQQPQHILPDLDAGLLLDAADQLH